MRFEAYHGVSETVHAQHRSALREAGLGPIALALAGSADAPEYSACWVERDGDDWRDLSALDGSQFQRDFDILKALGFAPSVIAATGSGDGSRFAAIFEKSEGARWFAHHGLPWDSTDGSPSLLSENDRAQKEGYVPKTIAIYGTPEDRRFAGVWIENGGRGVRPLGLSAPAVRWTSFLYDDGTYQKAFQAACDAGLRPVSVAPSGDRFEYAVFRDDRIGGWVARHDIDAATYQLEFDAQNARHALPVHIAATGQGSAARYSVIFASQLRAMPRRFSTTGLRDAALAPVDDLVETFMRDHGIRAASVCVLRPAGGSTSDIAMLRGYNWSEADYPQTVADSRFRLASLSKLFTCAAIDALVNAGTLTMATTAFPYLGVTSPLPATVTPDANINAITIDHLVWHNSGLPRGIDHQKVSNDLGLTGAPRVMDLVRWIYGQPLDFVPGSRARDFAYSNLGYAVLSAIVERATGRPFVDYVHNTVLAPLGLTDLWAGRTQQPLVDPAELPYESAGIATSCFAPKQTVDFVPLAYGGAFVLENSPGAGGLVSTAPTVARVIRSHAVWGIGGRMPGGRDGGFEGTSTIARSTGSGYDFACLFNRSIDAGPADAFAAQLEALLP